MFEHPKFIARCGRTEYFLGPKGVYENRNGVYCFVPRESLPKDVLRAEYYAQLTERLLSEALNKKELEGTWCHEGACLPVS